MPKTKTTRLGVGPETHPFDARPGLEDEYIAELTRLARGYETLEEYDDATYEQDLYFVAYNNLGEEITAEFDRYAEATGQDPVEPRLLAACQQADIAAWGKVVHSS